MSDKSTDLRKRLLDAQEMTPALRDACHKELSAMLEHRLAPRTRLSLFALLLLMLTFTIVGLRAQLFYYPGPLIYGVWTTFTIVCAGGALWIGWAIWRGRFLWSSYFPVADAFTVAATVITVLTLGLGLRAPSDPASVFGALYAFAFLGICIAWSLHNRIAAAELAAREQMLRIECRLAEMAGRLEQ
jgi:hypothetical protein